MATTPEAFATSTTDEAIIRHEVALDGAAQRATSVGSGRPIRDLYDVAVTAARIVEGGFQRIALQFPDEALVDSVPVFWALKEEVKVLCDRLQAQPSSSSSMPLSEPELYILADTSYGNCCVDEVAAQHIDADVVVHYGHSCLSPTARLPVIYVFIKHPIEVSKTVTSLFDLARKEIIGRPLANGQNAHAIVLLYDVGYSHASHDIYAGLLRHLGEVDEKGPPLVMSKFDTLANFKDKARTRPHEDLKTGIAPSHKDAPAGQSSMSTSGPCSDLPVSAASTCTESERQGHPLPDRSSLASTPLSSRLLDLAPETELSTCSFLYIGGESLALTNLLLSLGPSASVFSYDPATNKSRIETGRTNKLLMRRYALVQRARDAAVVALLIGTLGVHSYLPVLARLRRLLSSPSSERKVYTISVGKLNPAKLANFQEVDVFVLVACPENTLVDSRDFYRPIVTPWEMELALSNDHRWSDQYVLDLHRLLPSTGMAGTPDVALGATVEATDDKERDSSDEDPHFSLVTGTYISRQRFGSVKPSESLNSDDFDRSAGTLSRVDHHMKQGNTVMIRQQNGDLVSLLDSASGQQGRGASGMERQWRGLQPNLGADAPATLEEGRTGIASGYEVGMDSEADM